MHGSGQGRLTRIRQNGQMGEDEDLGRGVVESAFTAQHFRSAQAGIDPETASMTLAAYGESVMPLALRGLEGKTLDPYLAGWRKRVVPTLGTCRYA